MIQVLYVNSDHDNGQYIEESIKSARSFRKYLPDASFKLYTNTSEPIDDVFDDIEVVEFVVPDEIKNKVHKQGQMVVKHQAMLDSKYDYNLYLGCDTYAMHQNVSSPFELLDDYDFALAHAPFQNKMHGIPDSFGEHNCDVIYWRNNHRTQRFIKEWKRIYKYGIIKTPHDQGAFRYLAYHTRARVSTLPYTYNNRCGKWGSQGIKGNDVQDSVIIQNRDVIAEL